MADTSYPLVSVVTPTYNRAAYLAETIESVLAQGYPNIEYIVLDDGSTDKSLDVLQRYNGRIHWETHLNAGETFTVNKGWQMARGEFILVVNSDDPILPGLISAGVSLLQARPDLLMVYPDWIVIDESSRVLKKHRALDYDYAKMVRIWGCIPGPGALMRKRALELAPGRDPGFKYVADFEYWLRLGLHGPFARMPGYYATHRHHHNSAGISQSEALARELLRLADHFFSQPELSPAIQRLRGRALSAAYYEASLRNWSRRDLRNRYMAKSVYFSPLAGLRRISVRWFPLYFLDLIFQSATRNLRRITDRNFTKCCHR